MNKLYQVVSEIIDHENCAAALATTGSYETLAGSTDNKENKKDNLIRSYTTIDTK